MSIAIHLGLCAGLLLAACGDNGKECGEGTTEVDGRCVGQVVPQVTCAEGTLLDVPTNTCIVDPATCRGGTVFVRGSCQDATADLNPDLEEGAEPNGLGLEDEPSEVPAGVITLPSSGSPGVLLHGRLGPQPDRNEDGVPEYDVDTFVFDTTAPALLEITADGLGGVVAGFVVTSELPNGWARVALSAEGDGVQRRIFIPTAGRYRLSILDSRSLSVRSPRAVSGLEGEYFVTVEQHSLVNPQAITLQDGLATRTGTLAPNSVDMFTFTRETTRTEVVLTSPFAGTLGTVTALIGGELVSFAAEEKAHGSSYPAELFLDNYRFGEEVTLVVDHWFTTTLTPVAYELTIETKTPL